MMRQNGYLESFTGGGGEVESLLQFLDRFMIISVLSGGGDVLKCSRLSATFLLRNGTHNVNIPLRAFPPRIVASMTLFLPACFGFCHASYSPIWSRTAPHVVHAGAFTFAAGCRAPAASPVGGALLLLLMAL